MATTIELVTEIPGSAEDAFDLSLDVTLHIESMAGSKEIAIAGVTAGRMALNDEVTWRAWHFGLPWHMTSRITALERPRRFVDEQVRGPFAHFRHEHLFTTEQAATRMVDRIEFAAPLGLIGRVVERWVLASYLQGLIRRRNAYLATYSAER
jgi:ligand-binding SRPBCC domain-containing protein